MDVKRKGKKLEEIGNKISKIEDEKFLREVVKRKNTELKNRRKNAE